MVPWAQRAVLAWVALGFLIAAIASARAADDDTGTDWAYHDPFSDCTGECAVTVFGGQSFTKSSLQRIIFEAGRWHWDDTYLVGATVARPIVEYGENFFDIEPELGAGQRVGDMHQEEFWAALYFRVKIFPGNDILLTSFAMSTGFNYATGISPLERIRMLGHPAQWQHDFSPEFTFALPSHPEEALVIRIQHRSGFYGLINEGSGTSFLTAGIRFYF